MLFIARSLLRRPRRTALTVAGAALGAATYMAIVGAAQGFLHQFADLAQFFGADIVVQQAGATSPWSSNLSPVQVAAVAGLVGVRDVSRLGLGKAQLFGTSYFLVFGVDPGEGLARSLVLAKGKSLSRGETTMLLGEAAADKLKVEIGQQLEVRGKWVRVEGIYRTGHRVLDSGAVLDLGLVQTQFNLREAVNVVFIRLDDPGRRSEMLRRIAALHPDLEATAWDSWVMAYDQLALVGAFARLLALLAVLIAALGASNVLHMSVSERTEEIAVLRAIGWRRCRIAALILGDGAALSVAGGTCGIPLAAVILWALGSGSFRAVNTAGLIPAHLPLSAALEGVAVTLIAGMIGSIPPLVRALRVEPALALRLP